MGTLETPRLFAILRELTHGELVDMIGAMNLMMEDVASFLERALFTEEYAQRALSVTKAKLDAVFTPINRSGVFKAAGQIVNAFVATGLDEAALLELMLYAVESASEWACRTGSPGDFNEPLLDMFDAFVERLNRQPDDTLYRAFQPRIVELKMMAVSLGRSFGETLSESCLDIRWWGAT